MKEDKFRSRSFVRIQKLRSKVQHTVWPPRKDDGAADLIAHAHSAGPGVLDCGPLAKEPSARKRDQHCGNIASK